jgi:prephenate dehydrogenase
MSAKKLEHVRIVGSGLIGTSIGLALRVNDIAVTMVDRDATAQHLAQDLMGQSPSSASVDVVIIATPISGIKDAIENENKSYLNSVFMDVASVKTKVKVEVSAFPGLSERFVFTHPMAGREVGGAQSARGDLFQGRAWIYDSDSVSSDALELALQVVSVCGATAIELAAEEHDQAVALVSHLPQIAASLLAGALEGAPSEWLDIAGSGLRDTTRIAASDPTLWREIISSNSGALLPLLKNLSADLTTLIEGIEDPSTSEALFARGNRGKAGIPGKHGGAARNYTLLPVVIEDKAGQLAALFDECAIAGVNVEDLTIEHSPEQFTGLITLALSKSDAEKLYRHLSNTDWKVHSPRN